MARPVLVLATRNREKVKELTRLLGPGVRVVTAESLPCAPRVLETGRSLEENAAKKALALARYSGMPALGDDTGLEVDALNGAPGVRSARFAKGVGRRKDQRAAYEANNRKLLRLLDGTPRSQRGATFRCVMALAFPDGRVLQCGGRLRGRIADSPRGKTGFGFDPLFIVPRVGKTFAELGFKAKNRVSHRARALRAIRPLLMRALFR